jgi:hypothetical protein
MTGAARPPVKRAGYPDDRRSRYCRIFGAAVAPFAGGGDEHLVERAGVAGRGNARAGSSAGSRGDDEPSLRLTVPCGERRVRVSR